MRVKISTKEKLDSYLYNTMIVRELADSFNVSLCGEKCCDEYQLSFIKLSDSLKKMSDYQKVILIVEDFLENSVINSIEVDVLHVGCGGRFIKINGSRTLYLQINNFELLKTIIKMIKSKYDNDRCKYVSNYNDNLYDIVLREKNSSYDIEFMSCDDCSIDCTNDFCPKQLHFNLMYINGEIAGFDRKFIEKFISDKLLQVGSEAMIFEETNDIKLAGDTKIGSYTKSCCIICGDLCIRFHCSAISKNYILDFCTNIVNKYNNELIEISRYKKRQLKMEGF